MYSLSPCPHNVKYISFMRPDDLFNQQRHLTLHFIYCTSCNCCDLQYLQRRSRSCVRRVVGESRSVRWAWSTHCALGLHPAALLGYYPSIPSQELNILLRRRSQEICLLSKQYLWCTQCNCTFTHSVSNRIHIGALKTCRSKKNIYKWLFFKVQSHQFRKVVK